MARSTSTPTSRGGRRTRSAWPPDCSTRPASRSTTGVDFDPVDGGRFIRMCFAGDHDEIATALDLFGDWLARLPAADRTVDLIPP